MPTTLLKPNLMSGDHVGVTLDHRNPARLAAGRSRQVGRIEHGSLVKQKRFRAVKVLGDVLPLAGQLSFDIRQNSAAKADGPTAIVVNRKNQPASKPLTHRAG